MEDYTAKYHKERVATPIFDAALFWKLWQYLIPHKKWLIFAIILLIAAKLVEATVPLILAYVTQGMLNNEMPFSQIATICMSVIGILCISYTLDGISVAIKTWFGLKGIVTLRSDVYRHILHMPLAFYDRNPEGRLITRTIHDIDQINRMFAEGVVPIIGNIFLFVGILICVTFLDWRAGLIMAIMIPLAIWHTNYFRVNQRRCFGMIRSIVSAMNTFVQEHLMGFSTIRNFGLQKDEYRLFREMNEDHMIAYNETIRYYSFFFAGIDFIQSASLLLLFGVLVIFTSPNQQFQAGTYFAFSIYIIMVFRPLADLAERYNELQAAFASAERIFDVLNQEKEELDLPSGSFGDIEEISFEDVWFAYKDEEWVLKGLSFTLKRGESLAIVGVTGSGKTTIMSLLLRFYEPQRGRITVNGHDIRNYSKHALRSLSSVVLQDPVIFSGSIRDNLTLNNPAITAEMVQDVVHELGMDTFIRRYPHGLDEQIASHGKGLSLGEMQLISMARALVHKQQIIMLDEATANIDSALEHLIQMGIKRLTHNTTSIIIAHRLSTIRDVDRILVIHEGQLVEQGSHHDLVAAKGLYEKLYRLHFHSFK
jgi:ATP-binding cassette subfamily B protein